ncbi:glutaminyl-peptide cyclotransferase [Emticicia sp. BO119]|uniref:glutaminyl-peptide cyclotransferase n=1 Tax=Emticicia sp. BO119 TaxID=2757768 RepID=UPI0015F02BB6|nr:glutaminyl-peptide cyclotransferase [Emticicia sp. BO119]MBA4852500.1 glutaminyl-peptide cyclotransferase [Emticicia sp. BO119]
MNKRLFGTYILAIILFSCNNTEKSSDTTKEVASVPLIPFKLVNTFPHDTTAFTEGFLVHNNQLYESTGSPDELSETSSAIGILDLNTGKLNTKVTIDKSKYFGEGITILNDKIYQLTWKSKTGFVYDLKSFKKLKDFTFSNNEGWGLTSDGKYLIMSDGTYNLTYLDPNTLAVIKTLPVRENGYAKEQINELEYIKGFIYANIWQTNEIIKIDPVTGNVMAKIDLRALATDALTQYPKSLEMNGIAFDSTNNKVYVTGKMWPKVYQIDFSH